MNLEEKALKFATEAHGRFKEKRKFTGEDYIVHPIAVVELVKQYTNKETVIAAAYLHDYLESLFPHDYDFGCKVLEDNFSQEVSSLVYELSNTYSRYFISELNRTERKILENHRLQKASSDAKLIKLCDIYDNCSHLPAKESKDFDFTKLYIREKLEQIEYLSSKNDNEVFKKAWNNTYNLLKRKSYDFQD